MKKVIGLIALGLVVTACDSGGGSSTPSNSLANVTPYPYPPASSYPTPPLVAPPNFSSLTSTNGLQIAYGSNGDPQALNLVAHLIINGNEQCSATPVAESGGTTWLVTAAHCVVKSRSSNGTLVLTLPQSIKVQTGVGSSSSPAVQTLDVQGVYVPSNYCAGSSFSGAGGCPNFYYNASQPQLQGNDIALIQTTTLLGDPTQYPQLAPASSYPAAYTMAPVLSMGYGISTQTPDPDATCTLGSDCGIQFYVSNYYYQASNNPGYSYMFSSYFNNSSSNFGYSELVCGGDSGGPDLYWNGSKWLLLAEHTYGPANSCGLFYSYLPNASTNVSTYYSWLTSIIANPASCTTSNGCVKSN